jgi:adenosylcobinamide kinase/adenosylcobinamide-phosphate guanylyltransferase
MKSLTFVLGGARSGKSSYAERLASESGQPVLFVATAQAGDEEMAERIARHQADRPETWMTLETPLNVGAAIKQAAPSGVVLLDCLTLLATNVMMQHQQDDIPTSQAEPAVLVETSSLLEAYREGAASWIVISNEVGLGLVPPYPLSRVYRDALGRANQMVAEEADKVILMVAGLPWSLKGD